MEQITISGQLFNVPVRYEEGHELTAGEASALNQTFHENIRNNLANKAKKGVVELTQETVDAYSSEYQFGVRASGGGGVTRDPVMSRAMTIARGKVKGKLQLLIKTPDSPYHGKKISDFTAEAINGAAKGLIEKDPSILELARKQVAEEQSAAEADLSLVMDLETKPAASAAA